MDIIDEYNRNKFKGIRWDNIILDFSECRYFDEVHLEMKDKFELLDYYGVNWDALWDCLKGFFEDGEKHTVEIRGFNSLENELREYCKAMIGIFDEIHNEIPDVAFVMVS